MKTETHAIYLHNGSTRQSERMDVVDAYALIAEMRDQVAESYTVYAGEDDRPVGECYEIYEEVLTAYENPTKSKEIG